MYHLHIAETISITERQLEIPEGQKEVPSTSLFFVSEVVGHLD